MQTIWLGKVVFISVAMMVQWMVLSGSSASEELRELLLCFEKLEGHGFHWPWFTRVPSASNCADDPTRVGGILGKVLGSSST